MHSHGRCYYFTHVHHNFEHLRGRGLRYRPLNVSNLPLTIQLFSRKIIRVLNHFICSHGQFFSPSNNLCARIPRCGIQNRRSTDIFAPNKTFGDLRKYQTITKIKFSSPRYIFIKQFLIRTLKTKHKIYCKNIYLHNRELLAGIPPLEGLPRLDSLTTRVTQIKTEFWPAVVSCTQVDANVRTIFQMNPNWYFHKIWIAVKYFSIKWEHVILADIVREIDNYWSTFASRFTLKKFFMGVDLRHRSYEAISDFWINPRIGARKA